MIQNLTYYIYQDKFTLKKFYGEIFLYFLAFYAKFIETFVFIDFKSLNLCFVT
jgi:hypothetical protein